MKLVPKVEVEVNNDINDRLNYHHIKVLQDNKVQASAELFVYKDTTDFVTSHLNVIEYKYALKAQEALLKHCTILLPYKCYIASLNLSMSTPHNITTALRDSINHLINISSGYRSVLLYTIYETCINPLKSIQSRQVFTSLDFNFTTTESGLLLTRVQ